MQADPQSLTRGVEPCPSPAPRDPGVGGREPSRKAIHVAVSMAAAGIAWQVPSPLVEAIFVGAVLLALAIEVLRHHSTVARRFFQRAVGEMLRTREALGMTGATALAIGFALAVLLIPHPYDGAGIMVAGVGDAAAALVGRRYGRHRLRTGKSIEGSLACFVVALALAWAVPTVGFAPALLAALFLTILEALPLRVDDNVIIPVATAALLWGGASSLG